PRASLRADAPVLLSTLAQPVMQAGAEVAGIIQRCLVDFEVAHEGLTRQTIVDSMHERKQVMADWSDAFVLLPGGVGSLEEIFEMITWKQLQIHNKPIAILNADGYYDELLSFLQTGIEKDFVRKPLIESLIVETEIDAVFARLATELNCSD
ncbi:MAG: TIGR00730 family Rossman fold protein, partial [Planctomycetes bacterium]|nr:TIGR00730 family Rossman fold protein [Planctomycetota bacterium]